MYLEQLLKQCRFSKRYQEYYEFRECLKITLENEESLLHMTNIYMEAAARCNTSWRRVERNIRTLIDNSWRTGGRKELELISGCVLYGRPTVGEALEIFTMLHKGAP